jgi:excisionase family DNA binding protein
VVLSVTASTGWSRALLKANRTPDTVTKLGWVPSATAERGRSFMSTPGVEPRFYTLEDVATILNVRVAQVYALVRSGDLPAVKLGGRGVWRVDRTQLEQYIERMHAETREWAKAHPLIGGPEAD